MNTITVNSKMYEAIERLADLGWRVRTSYADAIVRMDGPDQMYVFVRADGSMSKPMTYETSLVTIRLREEGFVIS